jgi:DNA polymerase-3 subunit alpha
MINADLEKWLITNRLTYTIQNSYSLTIDNKLYLIIEGSDGAIINNEFEFILGENDLQNESLIEGDIEGFIYKFGTKWYYTTDQDTIDFKELRYLGKEHTISEVFPMLGIHGGYDLMNGSRAYSEWCKKANFCGVETLAICEENTLAGTLEFQNACEKAKINSVIGETITVKDHDGLTYSIKLYVENLQGWKNLLMINSFINVHNADKFILENQLIAHTDGLICVLTSDAKLYSKFPIYDVMFISLYFQIDVVQWSASQRDTEWLESIQNYINQHRKILKPILIADAYYLEKEHAGIKKELNAIGKVSFKNQSADQYFKTSSEQLQQLIGLFNEEDDERASDFIYQGIDNAKTFNNINFRIETGKLHLPSYKMTSEEKIKYSNDNDNMLWDLLELGLEKKNLDGQKYIDRIETEMKVICEAKLQDYFLITWDILNYAHNNNIATGFGRGSAAGSLVAYLLEIVHVDPLEYNLLFERFLNEGRLYKYKKVKGFKVVDSKGTVFEAVDQKDLQQFVINCNAKIEEAEITIKVTGSMPDIDNDIQGSRREDLKRYIETRYGIDNVAGIGTYSALKMKSALKDLAKRAGHQAGTMEYITAAIENDDITYPELFKYALTKSRTIKNFIINNPELIEKIPTIFDQPKTPSVHAGGVIIVPDSENGIFDQLPVKKIDGILISEWDMTGVEQAGFLKMDILGLKQLDKFSEIINLIKVNKGVDIVLKDIPLDDPKVYEYFGKGFNEDVFQFGGYGLKGYTRDLQPTLITDLIATSALYRPGPIEMKAHTDYVKRKNGGEISYPFGTEEILKETYGVLTYQEQVQQIVAHVADFTPNESDDVRKAIGKKLPELMKKYRERFIEGAVANGCRVDAATQLWDDIEGFGSYSFNKSHATCYSIMGYHCQWLKIYYPLEFWLTTLKYSSSDKIVNRLAEMSLIGGMEVGGPNINYSTNQFTTDNKKIFWSLQSVKQVGEKALAAILEEKKNGPFYSVSEFAKRLAKTAVNKATIRNLILTGAFDEIHNIKDERGVRSRFSILQEYMTFIGSSLDEEEVKMDKWDNYQWMLKQRELCGLGMINIKMLLPKVGCEESRGKKTFTFYPIAEALGTPEDDFSKKGPIIGGIITKIDEKRSRKKGPDSEPFALLEISDGIATMTGVMWSQEYNEYKGSLKINDLIFMKDVWIKFDSQYKKTNTFTVTNTTKVVILNQ